MSSITRALASLAVMSAVALSLLTSSSTSFASQVRAPTATARCRTESVVPFELPLDLAVDFAFSSPRGLVAPTEQDKTALAFAPAFDFPSDLGVSDGCATDPPPFML